jgi:hypothetical protein
MFDVLVAQRKGDRQCRTLAPCRLVKARIFKQVLDLGDRWSFYCVVDEVGKVVLEQKLPTTPEATKQFFQKIPHGRTYLEELAKQQPGKFLGCFVEFRSGRSTI